MIKSPLHVEQSGDPSGPAVVFLHALATSGWMWREQVERLPGFHCVVPDLPGHGKSNRVPWRSFADTARLVADVVRAYAPSGRAHVVGLSLGAYVGLQLISEAPEVADRVILSGVNVLPLPHKRLMVLMAYVLAPFIKLGLGAGMNARALRIPQDAIAEYRRVFRQTSVRAFLRANADAVQFAIPPNVGSLDTPTLIAAGEREHALILDSQRALVKSMPCARAVVAPGVGHAWNAEAPQLFAEMVEAWVRDRPLPDHLRPGSGGD